MTPFWREGHRASICAQWCSCGYRLAALQLGPVGCPPPVLCPPQRKRRVGDPALASHDAAGQGVPSRGDRPPEGRLLPVHPAQAPLLHHQHHRALCPHLLRGHPHLLPSCQGNAIQACVETCNLIARAQHQQTHSDSGQFKLSK